MNNRTVALIAAAVLALAIAWYFVPLPDGDTPATAPTTTTAPSTQPTPTTPPKQ